MTTHQLKTNTEPFNAIAKDEKTAEFRKNDRDFKVNDWLHLREYNPITGYTGRDMFVRISHVQTGYGIPEGYAMLSIKIEPLFA